MDLRLLSDLLPGRPPSRALVKSKVQAEQNISAQAKNKRAMGVSQNGAEPENCCFPVGFLFKTDQEGFPIKETPMVNQLEYLKQGQQEKKDPHPPAPLNAPGLVLEMKFVFLFPETCFLASKGPIPIRCLPSFLFGGSWLQIHVSSAQIH